MMTLATPAGGDNTSCAPRDDAEKRYLHLKDEEIDPYEQVVSMLQDAQHPNPTAWARDINPVVYDKEVAPQLRRIYINRKLIEVLGLAEEDTTDARMCLVDTGPLNVWLLLIKQSIVPVMVRYNLPNDYF